MNKPLQKLFHLGFSMFLLGTGIAQAQIKNPPIPMNRPTDYNYLSAPDSTGKRNILRTPVPASSKKLLTQQLILPYPIIFIHGLTGFSDNCWNTPTIWMDTQYGTTFAGTFNYCLNYDADYSQANTDFYPTSGADMAIFTDVNDPTQIGVGDYYYLNFDVGIDGSVPAAAPYKVESNQAAVVKQGLALAWTIYYVLQKTGRDKVILMGHSMGGLAAREYLQNPNLWQPDGKHHVAKLVTTGTPHGGSNASMANMASMLGGIDEQSEAVRDLRTSYFYSGDNGVYLYGGWEIQDNNLHMDDNWNLSGIDFFNVDVNCNGITGEYVSGLNSLPIGPDLDYSCIIGTGNILNGGDYVVDNENADINNTYSNLTKNIFEVSTTHTSLPDKTYENMQGLDEPNDYPVAYGIDYDTIYTGFTTMQSILGYTYDYDDYTFPVTVNSYVTVNISNISLADLMVRFVDSNFNNVINSVHSNGGSSINFTTPLNAGQYFLEIYGTPTSTSYLYPYDFVLTQTPNVTAVGEVQKPDMYAVYPNPNHGLFQISISQETSKGSSSIEIYNILGMRIYQSQIHGIEAVIDISNQPAGLYSMKLTTASGEETFKKIIKE